MLEVTVCSGLLLAFYQLLLARKVPYRACRRFLLGSALAAVVIPLLRLPILPAVVTFNLFLPHFQILEKYFQVMLANDE